MNWLIGIDILDTAVLWILTNMCYSFKQDFWPQFRRHTMGMGTVLHILQVNNIQGTIRQVKY